MKKVYILAMTLLLCSCKGFVAGDFDEKRERLHNTGRGEEYCQQFPDRCYKGIPW